MQGILKQKKIIVTFLSIIISLTFFFCLFLKFGNFKKEIDFDFTTQYDKVRISKGNIYLFNKTSLTRITNGKKIQKEIPAYKNIDMQDDIVYVLFEKSLAMYSKLIPLLEKRAIYLLPHICQYIRYQCVRCQRNGN